jgi:phosphatidylglycerol:prolipoprotein diacylglycerol transferase
VNILFLAYNRLVIELFPSRIIALQIGEFAIHWYGVMYLLAFVLAFILLPNLQSHRQLFLIRDEWASIISAAVVGVIIGGRLGYVLFYEPEYFSEHPSKILSVWEGGMSSHGGFIGVTIMLLFICWRMKLDIRKVADVAVVPIALGLALGRFGNFINQELYGTVTALPWGIHIPGVDGARHPTQLYAMIKDVSIALLCYFHLRYAKPFVPGRTAALFLMLYGVLRFIVEHFRAQTYMLSHIGPITLTRGQLLTIPVFLIGVFLWVMLRERSEQQSG